MSYAFNKTNSDTLLKAQFDILFSNSWWLIIGQFLLSMTMLAWLWNQVDHDILFIWYGLTFIPPLYRAYITYSYISKNNQPLVFWRNRYLFGSVVYGSIWGALVFVELSPLSFYFLVFVLAGLMVVTIGSSSTYLPAVISFIFPLGFFTSLKCLLLALEHPEQGWFLTFLFVLFAFLVMLISTRNLNKAIVTSLRLRYENMELINTLKEQNDEVEVAKDIAEKANADKSRFLAAASHDLRQPLHAMSLFLDAIRHCDEKQERLGLYEKLEKSVDSLGELFNALLDISKIDSEVIDIQPSTFYVTNVFKKVVHEFELAAKKKGILLVYLPSTIKVTSDPLWFERIVRNLVSNAIRYTDTGKILLTSRCRSSNCLVQVWDTGSGIPKEKLVIIFQEFIQLHNPQRDRNNGLGLGLAIVKRLCNLLGHSISVNSVVNKGSTFSLTLPISKEPVIEQNISRQRRIEDCLKNKTILIIDDEPDVCIAMAVMLEKWGCKVLVADSIVTVRQLLDKQNDLPSLIITDYRLADNITGLDVLSEISKCYRVDIPAILLTGETEVSIIQKINNSCNKVLHKPVKPAKLRIVMNKLLDA